MCGGRGGGGDGVGEGSSGAVVGVRLGWANRAASAGAGASAVDHGLVIAGGMRMAEGSTPNGYDEVSKRARQILGPAPPPPSTAPPAPAGLKVAAAVAAPVATAGTRATPGAP